MRTVRDEDGRRYLLLKESAESSLVRDPETGEERYLDGDRLSDAAGESPLGTAARGIPESRRSLVSAVRDDRTLGLLVELDERGPLGVREMLDAYDLCESDLHGVLAEFRTAGLVEEVAVGGERGYDLTGDGEAALSALRDE